MYIIKNIVKTKVLRKKRTESKREIANDLQYFNFGNGKENNIKIK